MVTNSTFNLSTTTQLVEEGGDWDIPFGVDIVVGIVIGVAILFAVIGNVLIIVSFLRDGELRTVYNLLIVNLAVTDLIMGGFCMPIYAVYTLHDFTWTFGYVFCKVFLTIDYTVCLQSALAIVLISLDRLIMIKLGAFYISKETFGVASCKIITSWIFSFLFYGPSIIGWDMWVGQRTVETGECDVEFSNNTVYASITAVLEFSLPFIAILVLNSLIFNELTTKQKSKLRGRSPTTTETVFTVGSNTVRPKSSNTTKQNHQRMAKVLAALVLTFGFFWIPYTISVIIASVCKKCINIYFHEATAWLLWIKATVNPFLYAFLNKRYRYNIHSIFCDVIGGRRASSATINNTIPNAWSRRQS